MQDKANQSAEVRIDIQEGGRTLQGIGALSAGASSRLLYDYPEPERSQILDYLFKPNYGAALNLLKVEIGGDTNSTCGSEASHMRMPEDLDGDRGYEWWLMKEAKERNPDIKLAALEWGAPSWFNGGFWSQDNIDYIISWLDCAESHGLTIDYIGGWNERGWDSDWYVALDEALNEAHPYVKIVAADQIDDPWKIATALKNDQAFNNAVDIVGVHDPCDQRSLYEHCPCSGTALSLDKPLWDSEQSSEGHNVGAGPLARAMNRQYIEGRMTANIVWSLISAWYANLPIADTGLILADRPWSGYYRVGKSIWVHAHTTQFTDIGWEYIDSACAFMSSGATYVTLKSPDQDNYTTVIETLDAETPTSVEFSVTGGLKGELVNLWSTNLSSSNTQDHFVHERAIEPTDGSFSVMLRPGHVYTLSTTTGQQKGMASSDNGPGDQLQLPFREDFEQYDHGSLARYFSDINGAFETAPCSGDRTGTCYRQVITEQPTIWNSTGNMPPTTLMGDPRWWGDYEVSIDALLEQQGYIELLARVSSQRGMDIAGYHLRIADTGQWTLYSQKLNGDDIILASGTVPFEVGSWHKLALQMRGTQINVVIDEEEIVTISNSQHTTGQIGIRVSPWQNAQFDDVQIDRTGPWPEFVPHEVITADATSEHPKNYQGYVYTADNAIDNRPETVWHSKWDPHAPLPQSITLDLGRNYNVQGITYQPRLDGNTHGMITDYNIYLSNDGETFTKVTDGEWPINTATKIATWTTHHTARYVRLEATKGVENFASAGLINVLRGVTGMPNAR